MTDWVTLAAGKCPNLEPLCPWGTRKGPRHHTRILKYKALRSASSILVLPIPIAKSKMRFVSVTAGVVTALLAVIAVQAASVNETELLMAMPTCGVWNDHNVLMPWI
jgi:hypothetical protein